MTLPWTVVEDEPHCRTDKVVLCIGKVYPSYGHWMNLQLLTAKGWKALQSIVVREDGHQLTTDEEATARLKAYAEFLYGEAPKPAPPKLVIRMAPQPDARGLVKREPFMAQLGEYRWYREGATIIQRIVDDEAILPAATFDALRGYAKSCLNTDNDNWVAYTTRSSALTAVMNVPPKPKPAPIPRMAKTGRTAVREPYYDVDGRYCWYEEGPNVPSYVPDTAILPSYDFSHLMGYVDRRISNDGEDEHWVAYSDRTAAVAAWLAVPPKPGQPQELAITKETPPMRRAELSRGECFVPHRNSAGLYAWYRDGSMMPGDALDTAVLPAWQYDELREFAGQALGNEPSGEWYKEYTTEQEARTAWLDVLRESGVPRLQPVRYPHGGRGGPEGGPAAWFCAGSLIAKGVSPRSVLPADIFHRLRGAMWLHPYNRDGSRYLVYESWDAAIAALEAL